VKILKVIRVAIVFVASACAAYYVVVFTTLIVGLGLAQFKSDYDVGNAGVVYYFLGIILGVLTAPFAGVLAVAGVERMVEKCK